MYWYDGELIEGEKIQLNISEPGLIYGANVFTTMRVYYCCLTHPLTNWEAHCDRLQQSLKNFNWQLPNWERLQQGAELLIADFPVLRMVIFPNGKEWIIGRNLSEDLARQQQQGITAWLAENRLYRRDLAAHKTGNYLGAYLAKQRALQLEAVEAILIDDLGNWLETSTGNLWGWQNDCWYTPALDSNILPGIGRAQLLAWLKQNNLPVCENIWTPEFVRDLQAIAYSNCVVEIVPINCIITSGDRLSYSESKNKSQFLARYFASNF
ncbi:MAG: aminotransferase class IV [Pleurocapsa sp.]